MLRSAASVILGVWMLVLPVADDASAQAPPPLALEPLFAPVASDITHVTHADDERLFVVERDGRILVYTDADGLVTTPFLDLSGLVTTEGDGGLLSMAFDPAHATNGRFFVAYTAGSPYRSIVARYRISSGDPDVADPNGVIVISVDEPFEHHNVGQLSFGPDGYLYAGFGDGGHELFGLPGCQSQRIGDSLGTDAFHGTILRLDTSQNVDTPPYYGIPADNPFADPNDGLTDEVWALGLRNPFRFSFDRASGALWIGDVGEQAREEVDRQPAASPGGENYGWLPMEGTSCFIANPEDLGCPAGTPLCFDPAYTLPLYDYSHAEGCAVIGGFVYAGAAIPSLRGHYVFGDFCNGNVWALDPDTLQRTTLATAGFGMISFGEDRDGELYTAVAGSVFRLTRSAPVPVLGRTAPALAAASLLAAALLARRRLRR